MSDRAYRTARAAALARDGACQVCGTQEGLTAHHKVPKHISRDDRPANLTTLCRACHTYVEDLDSIPLYLSWQAYLIRSVS